MTDNILITGGHGMAGEAIKSYCPNAIFVSSKDCDLKWSLPTETMFIKYQPKYVIHLAAKVGGVKGNSDYVADFYTDNIQINTNILKYSEKYGVKKVVSLLSTCVYPDTKYVTYPLTEDQLHMGPPHESNYGYAYAKRMLDVQSRAHNKQHGTKFVCAIPNNIFGEHDNFDLENGHVLPAIIRKIWEAKHKREDVTLWGDGSPLREFTYSKDVARALLFILWSVDPKDLEHPVNIGNTQEHSIKVIAEKVAKILDFNGKIIWDTSKPAGQFRKPSSNEKFKKLGFNTDSYTDLDKALKNTCDWFTMNYPNVRGYSSFIG